MLSNYIIEKQLGKGTYGVVYKVKKKDDNKIYVLKQISLIGLTQEQKADVKLEAQVLSKIKSKYVVQYYDSFEEDGKLNIIMEYCDSGDLNDFIEKHKQTKHLLSENIVWKIFIKITLGLADIHKLKILHRDLKSLNIFLKKDEDIRVGDLGVAKILNQTYFAKTFIGTPYYLSPEICEDKKYNDKSDVWALGCILYELCTYEKPFSASNPAALILKIINGNYTPLNEIKNGMQYTNELQKMIEFTLQKDYLIRPLMIDIIKSKIFEEKAYLYGYKDDLIDIKNLYDTEDNIKNKNLNYNNNVINEIIGKNDNEVNIIKTQNNTNRNDNNNIFYQKKSKGNNLISQKNVKINLSKKNDKIINNINNKYYENKKEG